MGRWLTVGLIVVAFQLGPHAQRPEAPQASDTKPPAFEVASIKPNTSGDTRFDTGLRPGGYEAVNTPLRLIIRTAYRIPDFALLGGPSWITDRFDVTAKANRNASQPELLQMLQSLLAARWQLRVHMETRELPSYALRRSDTASRNMTIRASPADCPPIARDAPPNAPPPSVSVLPCGWMRTASGFLSARGGVTMVQLAEALTTQLQRHVSDHTGMTGSFGFELRWAPELPPQVNSLTPAPPDDGPSLFTAVEEQLGLKLESSREPVDVLVIDHIERPTPD